MDLNNLVVIGSYGDEMKAQSVQMYLEASGVQAVLRADDCAGMRPHMHVERGVEILVQREDVPHALEILALMKADDAKDGFVGEKERVSTKGLSFGAGVIIGILIGVVVIYTTGRAKIGEWDAVSSSVKVDRNNDSLTDAIYYYGRNGDWISSKEDNNFDGKMDVWVSSDKGLASEVLADTDFNGEWDVRSVLVNGVVQRIDFVPNRGDVIVRQYQNRNGIFYKELIDTDLDGDFDIEKRFDPFGEEVSNIKLQR